MSSTAQHDRYGNPLTTASPEAAEHYVQAIAPRCIVAERAAPTAADAAGA